MSEMKYKKYKCVKPLTLKQLYLPLNVQDKITIQQGGMWFLVSSNKTKGFAILEEKGIQPVQMRCKITFRCFKEYFEEATE